MAESEDKIKLIEERVKFYLGDCLSKSHVKDRVISKDTAFYTDLNRYYNHKKFIYSLDNTYKTYINPLKNLIDEYNFTNKDIHIITGDVCRESLDFPVLSRIRKIHETGHNFVLVKCMGQIRHWRSCYEADIREYDKKINKAVWRGALTGQVRVNKAGDIPKTRLNNRVTLLEDHYRSNYADIALVTIPIADLKIKTRYAHMVKPNMSIQDLRNYKYIISIEGNDKDSGLNWKLMSNSVVLMAKPIYNSWLMEEKLIPSVHYVQLKDDLSDLEEKIDWCNQNSDTCKNIIHNANEYMKQFFDEESEKIIEREVITSFIKITND